MPGSSGHRLLGVVEVSWRAVGEAKVAQDVGGAVALCMRDRHVHGAVRLRPATPACPPLHPRLHTHTHTAPAATSQQMGHAAPGTHPGTAPLCPSAHTRCWSPGGQRAAPSCPQLSHRAAACSGTASLGMGCGGHGEEGERLSAAWSCHYRPPTLPPTPHPGTLDTDGAELRSTLCGLGIRHLVCAGK